MKVILIKKCKDGNPDDIVDVSDGYAKNFLIKNGFALPINHSTKLAHTKKLEKKEDDARASIETAKKAKDVIEKISLTFKLKVTNMVVHGSITKKQIIQKLKFKGVKIDTHAMEHIQISSLGITNVKVKVHKDIFANLKVEVKDADGN